VKIRKYSKETGKIGLYALQFPDYRVGNLRCAYRFAGITRFEVVSNIFAFGITAATAFSSRSPASSRRGGGASHAGKHHCHGVDFVHSRIFGALP